MTLHIMKHHRMRANAARANARRFAEHIEPEADEAVRAYLRHLAMSWNRIAEQHDFLADAEEQSDGKDADTAS